MACLFPIKNEYGMGTNKSIKNQLFRNSSKRATIWILTVNSLVFLTGITYSKEGIFKPGFSIKLTYGINNNSWGDINKCLKSFNSSELFDYMRVNFPDLITGEIRELNNSASDWEAEVRIEVGLRFALSLAASEKIIQKNESFLTYIYRGSVGDQISSYTFMPEVKVSMPVRLGICYKLPLSSKINIIFNTGGGYYSAKVSEYWKLEQTFPSGDSGWTTRYWETDPKRVFGFHGGIGLEYSLVKNFALVVEFQRRYAKLKDLKAIVQREGRHSGGIHEDKGALYYFNMWDVGIGTRYDNLEVWETPPDFSIWDMTDIRKAVLDLGGFSLRAGFKIKLF